MTDLNLLGSVPSSGGSGGSMGDPSTSMDSVEAAVAVVTASAVSLSSASSISPAITTNAMVANNGSMVLGRGGGVVNSAAGLPVQQQTGNLLPGNVGNVTVVSNGGPMTVLHSGMQMGSGSVTSSGPNSSSGHINEQAAISEIEKSLRQYEKGGNYSGSPPAYPLHAVVAPNKFLTRGVGGQLFANNGMSLSSNNNNNNNMSIPNNNQQQGQGFPMPPNYSQRPGVGVVQQRMPMGGQQVPRYQNMQRERLLMEQTKQQLVVPQNATNSGLNPGLADIGSLINNAVAPNVSLQRSNSAVRDSQLSPGFNANAFQQMSPGQNRAGPPFSPAQGAGNGGGTVAGGQQQKPQGPPPNYQAFSGNSEIIQPMSPQFASPEMMSLLGMNKGNNGTGNVGGVVAAGGVLAQQLSPRQPTFSSPQPQNQWTQQQQQQQQMSLQQQQNPMLSAQLTVSGLWAGRTFEITSNAVFLFICSSQRTQVDARCL